VLTIIQLQVAWTGTQLVVNTGDITLRVFVTLSSFALVGQLLNYYGTLISKTTRDWQASKVVGEGFNITSWAVIKSSTLAPSFCAEAVACLLHAPPILAINGKWGLLVIVRFYMVFRIIRDYSILYRNRDSISRNYDSFPPKFNWFLATKSIYHEKPFIFAFSLSMVILCMCGHVTYIFEREHNIIFTFGVCLYLSFISMITGWPTDTYDIYNPGTFFGRGACIVSSLLGLFLLSFMIEAVSLQLLPTAHQRPAVTWVVQYKIHQKLRHTAATIIQLVWRRRQLANGPSALSAPFLSALSEFRRLQIAHKSMLARTQETRPIEERLENLEKTLTSISYKLDMLLADKTTG